MDQDRQIRLLISPFFFFAALALLAQTGGVNLIAKAKDYSTEQLLAIAGAVGASALPGGYLLSSVTVLMVHMIARLRGWATHEAHLSETAYEGVWKRVGLTLPAQRDQELFVVATYDHELLKAGVHTWLLRRWNAFNVAMSSFTAIVLAGIVTLWLGICPRPLGWICLSFVSAVLVANGWRAWRQTMRMIEFQAQRPEHNDISPDESTTQPS